jgi:magnesium-transporting ATPase (P-type)
MDDREGRLAAASALVERDLELVGATAVEDKLQDGVPDCLRRLAAAGVKVWVLTGDKVETAVSIAHSCGLFDDGMAVVELRERDVEAEAEARRRQRRQGRGKRSGGGGGANGSSGGEAPASSPEAAPGQSVASVRRLLRRLSGGRGVDQADGNGTGGNGGGGGGNEDAEDAAIEAAAAGRDPSALVDQEDAGVLADATNALLAQKLDEVRRADASLGRQQQQQQQAPAAGAPTGAADAADAEDPDACSPADADASAAAAAGRVGLVIEGGALHDALAPRCRAALLALCSSARAVVFCRVSPIQKAQVVKLVRRGANAVTLGIGDGANDVGMIRAAHIGVGISGREGRAAVLSSDFALAQFRFLERLMLVHGRQAYHRNSQVVVYSFYKNWAYCLVFVFLQFVAGAWFGFFLPLSLIVSRACWGRKQKKSRAESANANPPTPPPPPSLKTTPQQASPPSPSSRP